MIQGDILGKEIALVFTADEYADGADTILATLHNKGIKASFFMTGNFLKSDSNHHRVVRMKEDGHYLGAHSDAHLLYCDWGNRDSLLVSQQEFTDDLERNFKRLEEFGIPKEMSQFFMPPFEWYNQQVQEWSSGLGLKLVNFTPGLRTAADYTYPGMTTGRYVTSEQIYLQMMDFEEKNIHGLNGFIILVHLGTNPLRTDKFYHKLPQMLDFLKQKGYKLKRIDDLLR